MTLHQTDRLGGVAHVRLAPLSECHEPMEKEQPSNLTAWVTVMLMFAVVGLGWVAWVALP